MRDRTRYDLFKEDLAGNPCWLESVEGFEAAVTEMEKFAANERATILCFVHRREQLWGVCTESPASCPWTTPPTERRAEH
jgi:hypothetical protein